MLPLRLLIIDPHDAFRIAAQNYALQCRDFRSVEVAASYDESLLLEAQHFPDLILIDVEIFSTNPGIINSLEKLKHSNPKLDILALLLFREDHYHRCQLLSSLVSGFLYKENFSEGLYAYLSRKNMADMHTGSHKGVD